MKFPQFLYYRVGDELLCAACLLERGIDVPPDDSFFDPVEGRCVRGHYRERDRFVATKVGLR